ncbi:hypothetical protein Glove_86g81 [Diversispora epigaea]|uniref:Protein kinase domain-containing protein n=1 Tax=Diversispora epigaea TaxID=1348612 RepID=A0A397J6N2_9GLOM|nr:hypothetical protein Glove_86g81 [Diversispora epigaea]
MSQEIEKIEYCPAGHSSNDFVCPDNQNFIRSNGICDLCTKEHFIQEFNTWSSENANSDRLIQESQINSIYKKLHMIPYDNFHNIKHIAEGGNGSVYSAKLENGIKWNWNFINQNWEYRLIGCKVALKEIKDSRYDIVEFLKVVKVVNHFVSAHYYGISKNPSTQNYIIVMDLFDNAWGLESLHAKNLVHCDLRSENNLINYDFNLGDSDIGIDLTEGGNGSVYSAKLENGIKWNWNFINQNWEYRLIGCKVALKEIKDSRYDIVEFLKVVKVVNHFVSAHYYGISKNPSTQNYIIVMDLFDNGLHDFLTKTFWDLGWETKLNILLSIAWGLESLHAKNLVHCDLRSENNLINYDFNLGDSDIGIDLSSCKLENDLVLNSNKKNNKIIGSIPYVPPEVLKGNEFTRRGDIYSIGGIMYEIVTAKRPFADQAHDTYLIIDICNGVRPKVPDFMLNWIPEWYLDLMYRCWSDDPSERPTAAELVDLFCDVLEKIYSNIVDNNVMRQFKIADENQKNTSKSQKQELFELFSYSSNLHPQSNYNSRYIHTLHELHDLLEDFKSGKSSDPNLIKSNEPTTYNVN